MRPVSGDELVTAALQSSLARAQKNYKLSNHKQLCKSGKFGRKSGGLKSGDFSPVKKSKPLKFQSEFDLWIEQAAGFNFVVEGFSNGATVPDHIECLNSPSAKARGILKTKKSVVNGDSNKSPLKGKNQIKTVETATENSFDVFTKFNESKKLRKGLVKVKKIFLKRGYSQEEVDTLIEKEVKRGGGVGAILQNLRQALQQADKKRKMKDFSSENGDGETKVARPETPPASSYSMPGTSTASMATPPRIMNGGCGAAAAHNNTSPGGNNQHKLPEPRRILYPREKIIPGYMEKLPVGAGFFNMGNSCYLNASLQAVFHVPAFINWLRHDSEHRKQCQLQNDSQNCIICAMKKTFDSATGRGNPQSAIRPVEIINRLRVICRHFSHGRQEDAHEFLRYLFESMERSYLTAIGATRLDNRSKETNPLGQIFGGYVRTEVTCLKCHYVSTTFQPTAELQLDIRHVTTLEDAIANHFKKERLDNNDYKCERCRTISQATKQFSLEIPPVVLCLQLKRFTLFGNKIAKRIHCNRALDMSRFMHKSKQVNGFSNLRYRLVALVTHLGSSPNCGHYTAIAEASNGQFYQFDDSYVHQVTASQALNNDAYVIIYEMDRKSNKSPESTATSATSTATTSSSSSTFTSNMTNLSSFPSSTVTSASTAPATVNVLYPKKTPTPVVPKLSSTASATATSSTSSKLVSNPKPGSDKPLVNGSFEAVNGTPSKLVNNNNEGLQRKMISFGIQSKAQQTPNKIQILKAGATLTGKSTSLFGSSSTVVKPTVAPKEAKQDSIKLVPYNDDEESDKDENIRNDAVTNGSSKRLKSPDVRKTASPKHAVSPITPPKSPKLETSTSSLSGDSCTGTSTPVKDPRMVSNDTKDLPLKQEVSAVNGGTPRDGIKRKAPMDDETTPKKSSSQRRRHASNSSASSSSSNSSSERSNKSKRKRSEDKSVERSSSSYQTADLPEREKKNGRESHSQERDRERRRDRNPSRSRSPSVDTAKDKRGSSSEKKRENGSFDPSRLRQDNVVAWGDKKSALSKSLEDDRKRLKEKSCDEDYDDEFDQGRVKKVRRSRSLDPRESHSSPGNGFQTLEDRKKQVEKWSSLLDGYGPGFRRSGSHGDSRSWSNDGGSRRRGFSPSPKSRHSTNDQRSNGSSHSNYSRNNHGRSPYRNGHHNGSNGFGNNQYRSQSRESYNHSSSSNGKHWGNDRNRH